MEHPNVTIDTIYEKVLILKKRSADGSNNNNHKLFYEILADLTWIKAEMEIDYLIQKAANGDEPYCQLKQ